MVRTSVRRAALLGHSSRRIVVERLADSTDAIAILHLRIDVSSALAGAWLGLEEIDDGIWAVHFCDAEFDRRVATWLELPSCLSEWS